MANNTSSGKLNRWAGLLRISLALALAFMLLASSGSLLQRTVANSPQGDAPQAPNAVFTNPALITIPGQGSATPYPSTITVSGQPTSIPATPGAVKVTFNGFNHTFPDDLGIVLVGPTGAALGLQSGAGDGTDMVNVTYTISDEGAAPMPDAGAWGPGTYKPTNYYFPLDTFPAPGPGTSYNNPGPAGGGAATFASTFGGTNPNGVWSLYVVDFVTALGGSIDGGWTLEINAGPTIIPQHIVDFDGDGKTDPAVSRDMGGQLTWYIRNSATGTSTTQPWGLGTDIEAPEDFDGDGKTDIAVWRGGAPFNAYFYILQSETNTLRADAFGQNGDDPRVVGDYDGDGKADVAVYRPGATAGAQSNWYYRSSVNGLIFGTQWGQNGDVPAPGDYDGDGRNDFVVRRGGGGQGVFYLRLTTSGDQTLVFGAQTATIAPGDYDGDQKTDICTLGTSGGSLVWNIRRSSDGGTTTFLFGNATGDVPVQGDYDGDGETDVAVYRPNANPKQNFFFWLRTSDGTLGSQEWGQQGDDAIANFNVWP